MEYELAEKPNIFLVYPIFYLLEDCCRCRVPFGGATASPVV